MAKSRFTPNGNGIIFLKSKALDPFCRFNYEKIPIKIEKKGFFYLGAHGHCQLVIEFRFGGAGDFAFMVNLLEK